MSALHPAADIRAESGGKKMAESRKKKDVPERSGKSSKTTQKSAAKRKTTNSSAKKSTRQTKQEAAAKAAYGAKMQDEVMVLLSFAVALILILSNFNLVGSVGKGIKWFMFGLFGVVEYIFPVIMAFTLVFMISNKNIIAVARIKTAAVYIFTIILSAVWLRIVNEPKIADAGIMEFFTYSADYKSGGGLFGGILCRILSPMGFWGTMVVLIILAIICIIVITEKSFINGILKVKKNGSRMMMAAKQDYDIYREHSNERLAGRDMYDDEDEETQEEYLARRRREKEAKLQEKYERQEERARKRMNKKARGVTLDTQLPKKEEAVKSVDVHEIVPDISVHDEYSADIYDPGDSFEYMQENVDDNIEEHIENDSYIDLSDSSGVDLYEDSNENSNEDLYENSYGNPNEGTDTNSYDNTYESPAEDTDISVTSDNRTNTADMAESDSQLEETEEIRMEKSVDKKKQEYVFPPVSLLNRGKGTDKAGQSRENKETAMRLQQTLQNFGVKVTITDISCGPAVTRYELQPEQGVKVSKIVSLSDDIKLNLAAADIRIEAPIPGKAAIGIEVPNKEAGSVSLRELIETDAFKNNTSQIAFAAGKDIAGKPIIADIAKMPHLLIAGATGSGKSVCINTIIMSILYRANPEDVKLIMIDPKVVELSVYNGIPHLLTPVVTDPKKASGALNWAVDEMTKRYKLFAKMAVRDLKGYNAKVSKIQVGEGETPPEKMPQIIIIIDELADLMMVAPGEVEDSICRLAQLARAAGIHLIIATQRPSVNVITGLIKANVPSRIAFSVSSGVDSRIIIDMNGAEKLLGKGDMLFFPSGYPKPVRVQGAFVSDDEVGKVVDFLKEHMQQEVTYNEEVTNTMTAAAGNVSGQDNEKDSYFADAGRFVIEKEKGSIGMLQRYYKIGFNRAGRIMDQLADAGVVGPELGTKPRKILMTAEEFEEYLKKNNL